MIEIIDIISKFLPILAIQVILVGICSIFGGASLPKFDKRLVLDIIGHQFDTGAHIIIDQKGRSAFYFDKDISAVTSVFLLGIHPIIKKSSIDQICICGCQGELKLTLSGQPRSCVRITGQNYLAALIHHAVIKEATP